MKIFDTFEDIKDMLDCKKRPVIVQCKRICEPFRVNSLEGDYKQGKAGDYIIKGIDGENYICDYDIFCKTYDIILPDSAEDYIDTQCP
jgi:hypothetical protein